jgi:membrane protease YdiL (CAAX protease family)
MGPLAAAMWTLAFFALRLVAAGITSAVRPGADNDIVNQGACIVLAASVTIFAIVRVHAPDSSLRASLGVRPISPLQALLSMAAGAGLLPAFSKVDDLIVSRWPYGDEEREALESLFRASTVHARVALVVVLVVVVPVALEFFFRGVLFSELTRATSRAHGAVVSAFCFAAWHLDPRALPTAFALGIAMARLRDQTHTVLAPVLGVLAFGAVDGIPWLRGRAPDADVTYPMRWVVGGAVIALLALAAIGVGGKPEKADDDAP